jgi:hypothetical protein
LVLAVLAGCENGNSLGAVPVRGSVTHNGQPLADGEVRYVPEDKGAGRMARGQIKQDGSFALTTATRNDGVVPGKYKVVVIAYGPVRKPNRDASGFVTKEYQRPLLVPVRYTKPDTTPITDIVDDQHSGSKDIVIE